MIHHIYSLLPLSIPAVSLILIAIFYAIILRREVFETFILSIATIISILFLSGLLNFQGSLLLGYYVLLLLSLFSFIFLIISYKKNPHLIKDISLIKSLVIFGVFFAFSVFLNYGRFLSLWDELTHWGSSIKNMYFLNALGTFKESSGSVGSYPPGISLFHYFWIRPFPNFTEYPAFIASNIVFFSLISTFFRRINLRLFLFLYSILLIAILFFPYFFSSIYVDTLMGILFGILLLSYFLLDNEKDQIYRALLVTSIATILILIKDTGLIFCLIALSIIFCDIFLFKRKIPVAQWLKENLAIKKIKQSFLFLPIIISLSFRLIWSLHLKITNAFSASAGRVDNGISQLLNNMTKGNLELYQYETIENFKEAIIKEPLYPLIFTYIDLLIILAIIFFIPLFCFKITKKFKKRLAFAFCAMIIGGILYTVFILFVYLSIFSSYEAVMLASYSRYILSYFIGIFIFLLIFLFQDSRLIFQKKNLLANLKVILLIVLLLSSFSYLFYKNLNTIKTNIIEARDSVHNIRGMRDGYDQILVWEKYFSEIDNKELYIISPGDQGYDYLAMIHTLYPVHIEWKQDYSVALEPYYPELNDPWTKIFTAEEWQNYVIEKYKFIFVFSYDEKFKEIYGHFFDELANNSFYKVETDEEGNLKIISLPKP